jgi:hypothetical protein
MALILTRINVGDYDTWKPMFDQDGPRAREKALGYRLLRSADVPGEVFVEIEFSTLEDAREARQRLIASGVLDRFTDKSGPTVVVIAEAK